VPSLDAQTLRDAMARFRRALEEHRDEINSLNVYPVPDGDTGTNMLLTQQAVDRELESLGDEGLADVGTAISRAALMGARGNSGVILAQALRGFVGSLDGADEIDAEGLGRALGVAAREAYRAVSSPARGTMLDVLADAARSAGRAAVSGDVEAVAGAALEEARASLARTPDLLPELRRAGVVDAGGKGIVVFLDSLHAAIADGPMTEPVGTFGPVGRSATEAAPPSFKFEVQFLLEAADREVAGLRSRLGDLGDSLVIVGGGGTFKVHLHTNEPDGAVALAEAAGRPSSVSISDLEGDVERCTVGEARGVRAAEVHATALVAVADGAGVSEILASLGAVIVPGGPGNNPSVEEILRAIETAPSSHVVVLPNHENVSPSAQAAAEQAEADIRVVPTRSIAQGVSAAAAFHPDVDLDANARALADAADAVAWGEVATAVRDADTPVGPVRAGQLLAIDGGEVVAAGEDAASVVVDLVRRLRQNQHEVLTVFTGADVTDREARDVERALRSALPDLDVEVHPGGQPGYPYVIGLE
jgi:fatty acid kinase